MKVRIGFGVSGTQPVEAAAFASVVDALEDLGWDSLWLAERIGGAGFDPVGALAFAAGRTRRIKVGTSVAVLPGRNPALVAKEWATLAVLSGGRALPAFGLGAVNPNEQQAFAVERSERAARFDEMLPLLRRIWSEPSVDHQGRFFHYEGLKVEPKPPAPLDVWLGGRAPSELRRAGRLGDGWLASFATPEDVAASRPVVDEAAAQAGREIDPEHYGAMVFYRHGDLPPAVAALVATRNEAVDPEHLIPKGWAGVRRRCEEFVAVGFSKLIILPFGPVEAWPDELAAGADALLDLQT